MIRLRRSARPGRSRGQATVELALGFPVIVIAVLLVLQLALVGRDALLVTHAAREGARAAAVDPRTPVAAQGVAASSTALDPARTHVELVQRAGRVTVRVRYQAATGLPLVGRLVPDPVLEAAATMREEPRN